MTDRRLLACFLVLLLFAVLVGSPAFTSARDLLIDEPVGEVDTDCLKGGDGNAGDDDAWANGDGGPPAETHEKVMDDGRKSEEVHAAGGELVTSDLSRGILFWILFSRLFVL